MAETRRHRTEVTHRVQETRKGTSSISVLSNLAVCEKALEAIQDLGNFMVDAQAISWCFWRSGSSRRQHVPFLFTHFLSSQINLLSILELSEKKLIQCRLHAW